MKSPKNWERKQGGSGSCVRSGIDVKSHSSSVEATLVSESSPALKKKQPHRRKACSSSAITAKTPAKEGSASPGRTDRSSNCSARSESRNSCAVKRPQSRNLRQNVKREPRRRQSVGSSKATGNHKTKEQGKREDRDNRNKNRGNRNDRDRGNSSK